MKHLENKRNDQDELLRHGDFPHKSHELRADWMRKKLGGHLDTKTRLFGPMQSEGHLNSMRAQHLRDQELRGRDYNAISLTKYEAPN